MVITCAQVLVYNDTTLHPLGAVALLVLGAATLLVARPLALVPIILMASLVSAGQRIAIGSLDFDLLRILFLIGWIRVIARQEFLGFRWRAIDTAFVAWVAVSVLVYVTREGPETIVYKLGNAYDEIGGYFLFRWLLRDWRDADRLAGALCLIAVPVAFFFLVERATGRNCFSVFGGVAAVTAVRDGRLRCQGPYAHPILAGCFWAVAVPLMAAQWWQPGRNRKLMAVAGVGSAVLVVVLCASSTPLMGLIGAAIGGAAFLARHRLGLIRVGTVLTLIALHMVMKAPVWSLLARVDVVGGSTGYHRYQLVDGAINHFSEWAILGTSDTTHWGDSTLADVCMQYVGECVEGGILTFALFMLVLVLAFSCAGTAWQRSQDDRGRLALAWAIGVSLFVHCVNFLGVAYFGQISVLWYLSLALAASLSTSGVWRGWAQEKHLPPNEAQLASMPR